MKKLRHYFLKFIRWGFILGFSLFVLIAAGVGVGLQWLQTQNGQAYLIPKVVGLANKTIHGVVGLRHVSFNIAGFFQIEGVTVVDPEHRQALVIEDISGRISYLSLFYLNPSVSGLTVKNGNVALVKEKDGTWNLSNAFQLRNPTPKTNEKSSFSIDLNDLQIDHFDVTVAGLNSPVDVKGIHLKSDVFYSADAWDVDVETLELDIQQPVQHHVVVKTLALGRQQNIEIKNLSMQSDGLKLDALGTYQLDTQVIDFNLSSFQVSPELIRHYAPLDLQEPIRASATAKGTLQNLAANIQADAGRGGNVTIDARGNAIDVGPLAIDLTVRQVDVSAYKKDAQKLVLNASARVRELSASFAKIENLQVKSDKFNLTALGTAKKLPQGWLPEFQFALDATLPQAVTATGFIRNRQFDIQSRIEAKPKTFVSFETSGGVQPDLKAASFSNFKLLMPGNNWANTRPFQVVFKPHIELKDFYFASGRQQLKANGLYKESGTFQAIASLSNLRLEKLPYYLLPHMNRMVGLVNAQAKVQGTTAFPIGNISFSLTNGEVSMAQPNREPDLVFHQLAFNGRANLDRRLLTANVTGNVLQTPVRIQLKAPRRILQSPKTTRGIVLDIEARNASVENILRRFNAYPIEHTIAGRATLIAKVEGSVVAPTADIRLDVSQGRYDALQNVGINTRVTTNTNGRIQLDATVLQSQQRRLKANLSWQHPTQSGLPQNLETVARGQLNAAVQILSVPLKKMTADENVSGNVEGSIRLVGSLNSPQFDADVFVRQLGNAKIADGQGRILATYANQKARVDVKFTAPGNNSLDLHATASPNLGLQAILAKKTFLQESPIDVTLNASLPDISIFQPLFPSIKQLSGGVFAEVKGRGPFQKPIVEGKLYLTQSLVGIKGVRTIRIEKLNASIANDVLELKELEIRSGGELSANGRLVGLMAKQKNYVLSLTTRSLMLDPARYPSDTVDSRFAIQGQISPELMTSTVSVNQLRVWIPKLAAPKPVQSLKTHPDIVVVTGQNQALPPIVEEQIPDQKNDSKKSAKIQIQVNAPKNIFVQGPDLLLELMTNLKINIENNVTTIAGNITNVRPGQLKFYGREIRLDETSINFRNEEPKNAALKIDATYPTSEAMVMIEIRGTAGKPELKLKSDPPLPEFRIASLLIGGDRGDRPAEGQPTLQDRSSTIAANALGSFVSSKLESALFPRSPLTLNVNVKDPNERSGDVSIGKYINPDLFVSYERNFGMDLYENTSEVHFDYRLARRWTLEGFFGDAQEGGLDILWKKSF